MNLRCFHIITLTYLIIGLNGCFGTVEQRPAEWSPSIVFSDVSGCPDISGHYQGSGKEVGIGYLTGVLFYNRLDEVHSQQPNLISSLKIDQEGNKTLHVTAYNPFMEIEAETTLSHDKADYECTHEAVELSQSLTYFWFFLAEHGRGKDVLSKTEEGSLVVKTEGWLGGYLAFIPFGGHNLFWNKFDPCCTSEYEEKATERYRDACRRINETVSYARCLQHFKPRSECNGTWEQIKDCIKNAI